jgi:hypothetical protein
MVNPTAIVGLEGLDKLKSVIAKGIKPATFRLITVLQATAAAAHTEHNHIILTLKYS